VASLTAVALDDTDPAAGPQLLIGGNDGRLRAVSLRSRAVTAVAGARRTGLKVGPLPDGPASRAVFGINHGIAVAPNGVVFVADYAAFAVRRVSAPVAVRRAEQEAGGRPPERMVTTLMSRPGSRARVWFAESPVPLPALPLPGTVLRGHPAAIALHAPVPVPVRSAIHTHGTADVADVDVDVGCLYVGMHHAKVKACDLSIGESKEFGAVTDVLGLALTQDGTRLFVVDII
jgi:hypothetical protein